MKTTIKILPRELKKLNGEKPIILRVTKNRKSKIITLGLSTLDSEWDFEKGRFNRKSKNYQHKNRLLIEAELKGINLLEKLYEENKEFSLNQFLQRYFGQEEIRKSVKSYLENVIQSLERVDKYSSAEPYKNLKSALFKFADITISFQNINYHFLKKFEHNLRIAGNSDGGIAFKMRTLRSIFNSAINENIIQQEAYPFRRYKISKLKGADRKIALNEIEFRKFESVNLQEHPELVNAHKLFLFSFYCRGMNWKDMILLKQKNIFDNKLHYKRSKTNQKFVIEILNPVKDILTYFEKNFPNTEYVFPYITIGGLSSKQFHEKKRVTLKKFNNQLKQIGSIARISKPITSYVARHTYATILKNKGVSIEIISELMGHSSVNVTMSYLKDFENEILDDASKNVLEEQFIEFKMIA